MKKKLTDLFKSRRFATGCAAIAAALVIGSVGMYQQSAQLTELPVYTDPVMEVSIEEEETPLASKPTTKTSTKRKTSTKKVKLKKVSSKSYIKSLPSKKKTSQKTRSTSSAKIVTKTTVTTAVKEKYTRRSKVKSVTTTTTTVVKTTTTPVKKATTTATASQSKTKYTADVAQLAPKMDSRVLNAYKKLGFTVTIDPSVSYAGYFNAGTRSITLKEADDTIYHELGHFLAFVSGNTDRTGAFQSVYSQEKSKFSGVNKAYATQSSSEYFAESTKDYIVNGSSLRSTRPQTYAAVSAALDKLTDAQVTKVQRVYSAIWK